MIEWCWRAANGIDVFDRVVVATDSDEIEARARGFDAEVVRTRSDHRSGTDRVEDAAGRLELEDTDVVVNFQADEPFVDAPTVSRAVFSLLERSEGETAPGIATLAAPIRSRDEWESPGIVKVARAQDGRGLYFSRSPIPHARDQASLFQTADDAVETIPIEVGPTEETVPRLRHIGVYACARAALGRWAGLPESPLERAERLEQLRALEAGMHIHVEVGPWTEPGIDLPADLERAERVLSRVG